MYRPSQRTHKLVKLGLVSWCLVFAIALLPTTTAHATETATGTDTTEQTAATGDFVFTARQGDSLSVLVRRALQLYDEGNDELELTHAQAMFAETKIVKEMGSIHVNRGQTVKISRQLVDQYAQASQSLTKTELAAWQRFARQADFHVSDIKPVEQTGKEAANKSESPAKPDENKDQTAGKTDEAKPADEKKTDKNSDWGWVALVVLVIAVLFLIRRNQGPADDTSSASKPAKRNSRSRK